MENNNILEQPSQDLPCHQGVATQQDSGCDSNLSGSKSLGKFKDPQALLNAYNNLQSEFTKKCQSLAEVSKQLEENKQSKVLPSRQTLLEKEFDEFTKTNTKFATNKQEILSQVSSECDDTKQAVLDAVSHYAIDNYCTKADLIKDPDFLQQYVYSDPTIQQTIIQQYFDNITLNKSPNVIATHVGSQSVLTPKTKPTTLQEAGNIVRSMFGE